MSRGVGVAADSLDQGKKHHDETEDAKEPPSSSSASASAGGHSRKGYPATKDSGISGGSDSHSTIHEEEEEEEEDRAGRVLGLRPSRGDESDGCNDGDSESSGEDGGGGPGEAADSGAGGGGGGVMNIDSRQREEKTQKRKMYRKSRKKKGAPKSSSSRTPSPSKAGGEGGAVEDSSGEDEEEGFARGRGAGADGKDPSFKKKKRASTKDANGRRKEEQHLSAENAGNGTSPIALQDAVGAGAEIDNAGKVNLLSSEEKSRRGSTPKKSPLIRRGSMMDPPQLQALSDGGKKNKKKKAVVPPLLQSAGGVGTTNPVDALLDLEGMQEKKRAAVAKGMSEAEAEMKVKQDVKIAIDKVVAISAKGSYESGAAELKLKAQFREQLEKDLGKLGIGIKSRRAIESVDLMEDPAKEKEKRRRKAKEEKAALDLAKKLAAVVAGPTSPVKGKAGKKKERHYSSEREKDSSRLLPSLKNRRAGEKDPKRKVVEGKGRKRGGEGGMGTTRDSEKGTQSTARSQSLPPGASERKEEEGMTKTTNKGPLLSPPAPSPPPRSKGKRGRGKQNRQKSRSLSPLKGGTEDNRMGDGYDRDGKDEEEEEKSGEKGEVGGDEMLIGNHADKPGVGTKMSKTVSQENVIKTKDEEEIDREETEDFIPDQMPTYARSYILPKVMKRSSVLEARRRRQEQKNQEKRKSLETTRTGKRKVSSYIDADDAADEKFKWGMIKASLEYESSKLPASLREESDEESGADDNDSKKRSRVPGKSESTKDFVRRERILDGSSKAIPAPNSLLPVKGPGQLRRYIKYVKDENYVPVPVLEPERAVDHGLFAKKGRKGARGESDMDELTSRSASRISNVTSAHNSITAQYENIVKLVKKASEASAEHKARLKKKKSSMHYEDLDALGNVDLDVPQVSRATSRASSRESSRVPSRASSGVPGPNRRKRKKGRMPLPSLDIEDIAEEESKAVGGGEAEPDGRLLEPPPAPTASSAGESGYSTGSYPTSLEAASTNGRTSAVAEDDDLFGLGIGGGGFQKSYLRAVEEEDDELDQLMQEAIRIAEESHGLGGRGANLLDDGSTTEQDGRTTSQSEAAALPDYVPPDSEVYREWMDANILQDAMQGRNLLGMLEESKPKFNDDEASRGRAGERGGGDPGTIDLFIDRHQPFNFTSERHPVLQEVLQLIHRTKTDRAEKLKVQEDLFRMRSMRREGELRREYLLNKAKILQARATKHKARLSVLWEEKLKEELRKTRPLEEVCAALREELDAAHRQRIEAFEIKMKPIIIRDGPSKKANYKIQAARLHYEIYALTQRLRHANMRAEHEEQRRERREKEVRRLREEISDKKTAISTVTKGIPFTKLEVRPEDQLPPSSFQMVGFGGGGAVGGGGGHGGGGQSSVAGILRERLGLPVPTSKASMIMPVPRSQVMAPPSMAAGVLSMQQRQASAGLSLSSSVGSLPRISSTSNGNLAAAAAGDAGGDPTTQPPPPVGNGRIPNGGARLQSSS